MLGVLQAGGGGSGGGRAKGGRLKKGRDERKEEAWTGLVQRSSTLREVGCDGQENRWEGVWGEPLHEGQRSSGALPTLTRYDLRAGQNPERSCERVVRCGQGREGSSSEIGGGWVRRILLGFWEFIEKRTVEL